MRSKEASRPLRLPQKHSGQPASGVHLLKDHVNVNELYPNNVQARQDRESEQHLKSLSYDTSCVEVLWVHGFWQSKQTPRRRTGG